MNKQELFMRLNDVRTDLDVINQQTNQGRIELINEFIKSGKSEKESIEKWSEILERIQNSLNDMDVIKKILTEK